MPIMWADTFQSEIHSRLWALDGWLATEKPDIHPRLRALDGWRTTEKSVAKGRDYLLWQIGRPFKHLKNKVFVKQRIHRGTFMTKKEAIFIISKCALLYESNLCNRQLAFVYRNCDNLSEFIEVSFRSNNFMHFTGIETAQNIKANAFYRNAIDKRLKESDILFKNNHTTEMKLQILQAIMKIPYSARMIGDYAGPHLELYTEKLAGTTTACLGLIKNDTGYIPNTILKEDIRNLIPKPPGKIFAIFRKQLRQPIYTELTFQSNRPEITKKCLPENLKQRIDQSLFISDQECGN